MGTGVVWTSQTAHEQGAWDLNGVVGARKCRPSAGGPASFAFIASDYAEGFGAHAEHH